MRNYFKQHHLTIIGIIAAILVGIAPFVLNSASKEELAIVPIKDVSMYDSFWLSSDSIKLNFANNRIKPEDIFIKYFVLAYSGKKAVEAEDFIKPISIQEDKNEIVYISACSKGLIKSCGGDKNKISPVETEWSQKKFWELKPLIINPQDQICFAVVFRKSTSPDNNVIFDGRIKNVEVRAYNSYDDFAKKNSSLTSKIFHSLNNNYMLLRGIEIHYYTALSVIFSFIIVSAFSSRGFIPQIKTFEIFLIAIATTTASALANLLIRLFNKDIELNIFGYLILAITAALIIKLFLSKKDTSQNPPTT